MAIGFFGIKERDEEMIRKALDMEGVMDEARFVRDPVSPEHIPIDKDLEVMSVFVNSKVTKDVIARLPSVKMIVTRSTGYDHIDVSAAKEKGIVVTNVPSYGEHTVAEFAFALLLTLSRRMYPAITRVKTQGQFSYDGLEGFDLNGKTIGIIGTGRIGRHSVAMARGFDMKVIAYDPQPDTDFAKKQDVTYMSLRELASRSDVITIHVPYLKETHHLVNREFISHMKRGAILINTARGGIVDTEAMVEGLRSGVIGGVGLDVLEEEGGVQDEISFMFNGHPGEKELRTVLANHILMELPNVIITPHNAFNTIEARQRIFRTTAQNIKAFFHHKPMNVVS